MNKVFEYLNTLPSPIVTEEVVSSFPSIKSTLVHVYVIDKGWLSYLLQEGSNDIEEMAENVNRLSQQATATDMVGLRNLFNEMFEEYDQAFNDISDFEESISIFFGQDITISDLITHVVNHGTNHRGNISTILRQLGFDGCNTDYGSYLFEIK